MPQQIPPKTLLTPEQAKEIHMRQMAEVLYMQLVIEGYKRDSVSDECLVALKELAFAASKEFVK